MQISKLFLNQDQTGLNAILIIEILLFIKAPPKALKTYTNPKPHQVAVATFSQSFCSPVSCKTATQFLPTSGELEVACAPLHKHLQLLRAVPNTLRGWTGWGNTHIPLLIINSKESAAPSTAQQPHHTEYFPWFFVQSAESIFFRKYYYFVGRAQIKISPTWAAILTYFHFFYNKELLYTKFSDVLGEQLTTEADFYPCSLPDYTECCRCSSIGLKYTTPTQSHIFSVWERFCTALSTVLLSSVLHILRWENITSYCSSL